MVGRGGRSWQGRTQVGGAPAAQALPCFPRPCPRGLVWRCGQGWTGARCWEKPVQMSAPCPAQLIRGAGRRSRIPHPHWRGRSWCLSQGKPSSPPGHGYSPACPQALFRGVPTNPTPSEPVHLSLRRNPNTLRPRAPQIRRREGQRERRQKHGPEPARPPPQGPGGRPCHGSLSRPQGHQGQHWALWLLRSRTAPGTRGEGHGRQDRTGQEGLILTENAICSAASRKQHRPCPSLSPWRLRSRA